MAKTLIIKGANFSTNKLTTVEFSDIPCTGISLSESSVSFTDYTSETIICTVTPADTTDSVVWASSDETVATVENGVITPVGIGNCTITATCGEESATVSVTVAIAYILSCDSTIISHANNAAYAYKTASSSRVSLYGSGSQAGTYEIPASDSSGNKKVIKLPLNTRSVTISITNGTRIWNSTGSFVFWLKDEASGDSYFTTSAKWIKTEDGYNMRTNTSKTFNVPSGADSMVLCIRIDPDVSESETAESIINGIGVNITFNATETA